MTVLFDVTSFATFVDSIGLLFTASWR